MNVQTYKKGNRFNQALVNGLVSYWKFNQNSGDAPDSVGPNTLTNNGGATYVAGILGNAVNLTAASSQYMSITNAAQVGLGITSSMSVSTWLKLPSQPASAFIVVSKFNYSTGNERSYQFYYEDFGVGDYRLSIAISSDGIGATIVRKVCTLTLGTFHHVVYVFNAVAGTGEIYVDGVSLGSTSGMSSSIYNGTADFRIGANHAGLYFNGAVDETGVWNRVLTSSQITALYNNGRGKSYPFV